MERQTITGSLSTSGRLSGALSVGGGTTDYNVLVNKPKINNVELVGNKNYIDLGLEPAINYPDDQTKYYNGRGQWTTPPSGVTSYNDLTDKPSINGVTLSGNKTPDDFGLSSKGQFNSLSGVIVSFNDGQDLPLAKCIAEIVPKQAGSGTPSPDNVRAISGYTAVKVDVVGKNRLNGIELGSYRAIDAEKVTASNRVRSSSIFFLKQGTYTFSASTQASGKTIRTFYQLWANDSYGANTPLNTPQWESNPMTFTLNSDIFVSIILGYTDDSNVTVSDLTAQLEKGSTATTYEVYAGSTTTTPLGQTVYGGQLNVLTGELTIDRVYLKLTSDLFTAFNNTIKAGFTDGDYLGKHIMACNALAPSYSYSTATDTISVRTQDGRIIAVPGWASECTDLASFKTAYANQTELEVVHTITPQTVQLTPQEVNSLLGQNNISADTGAIGITYINNVNDPIIKYILNNM